MAEYSILGEQEIKIILSDYGISEIITCEVLSGGSENTNYVVITEKGKFVVTICEQKSVKQATDLALTLEHLAQHGFSTSEIVRSTCQEPIMIWNTKPVMLKIFLEGKIMTSLPNHIVEYLGEELGRLHKIEVPPYLPKTLGYGKEHFSDVEDYEPNSSFCNWLEEIKQYVEKFITPDLAKALIHSDLFYSNVVVDKTEKHASIMDFEEATYYYRIFDIGMTIIGICADGEKTIDLEKTQHLLRGYNTEVVLLDAEWRALQAFTVYAAASMSLWRYKQFNFIHPNPERSRHYLQLKNLADHAKGLPPRAFSLNPIV